jgi:ferrochelatase
MKIAVVLFNLGGPTDTKAVRPFLFNLFKDKNIIRLPAIFRYPLGYLISTLRYKKASKIYAKLGGGSPINLETQKQVDALEKALKTQSNALNTNNNEYKTFYCMQYWHPMHAEVIEAVKKYEPDTIILLPLYPQFSTTTTKSSFEVWHKKSKGILSHIPHRSVCCYPQNTGFIRAYGELTLDKLKKSAFAKDAVILYSAHGIPQDCIDDGDPYEEQVTKTAYAIQEYLKQHGFHNDFKITYQSKVGPKKWLEPDTESIITQFASDKKPLVIVPLAFTSEHSETLVELDMDYQELAVSLGCPDYMRVPAVTDNSHFINGLKDAVLSIIDNNIICNPSICSDKFKECPKKNGVTPCITI